MDNAKQNFKDLLAGAERLIFPWRMALIVTNALWAAVLAVLIGHSRTR